MPKTMWAVRVTTTNRVVRAIPKTRVYGVKIMAASRNTARTIAHAQLRRLASPISAMYMTPKVTPLERWYVHPATWVSKGNCESLC